MPLLPLPVTTAWMGTFTAEAPLFPVIDGDKKHIMVFVVVLQCEFLKSDLEVIGFSVLFPHTIRKLHSETEGFF